MIAGAIAPASATLVAYYLWPQKMPVTLTEAIGIATFLGAVGAATAFLLLLFGTRVKARLIAPFRVWAANQAELERKEKLVATLQNEIGRLSAELLDLNQDQPALPDFIAYEGLEDDGSQFGPSWRIYIFKITAPLTKEFTLRATCGSWVFGSVYIEVLSPTADPIRPSRLRRGEKTFTFSLPAISGVAQLRMVFHTGTLVRIKKIELVDE